MDRKGTPDEAALAELGPGGLLAVSQVVSRGYGSLPETLGHPLPLPKWAAHVCKTLPLLFLYCVVYELRASDTLQYTAAQSVPQHKSVLISPRHCGITVCPNVSGKHP